MSGEAKDLILGKFSFNGDEFEDYAEDLPPGACQGMLACQDGFVEVHEEIKKSHAEYGARAGITDADVNTLDECSHRIERLDIILPAMAKALEVLTETRYKLEDQRQRIVLNSATSVDRRAKRDPKLLAVYERTRVYRSAAAKKALKTKAKKGEQKPAPTGTDPPKPATTEAGTKPATPDVLPKPGTQAAVAKPAAPQTVTKPAAPQAVTRPGTPQITA